MWRANHPAGTDGTPIMQTIKDIAFYILLTVLLTGAVYAAAYCIDDFIERAESTGGQG